MTLALPKLSFELAKTCTTREVEVVRELGAGSGAYMFGLAQELWPLNRSLLGPGFRESLDLLRRELPRMTIHTVPSGTEIFDWTVPHEWHVEEAYIVTPSGQRICDFTTNNLHLVGYSPPVDIVMNLEDLLPHLHSLPDQPDAIPYVTSYYKSNWGFCLPEKIKKSLTPGRYRVVINSSLTPGTLQIGDFSIRGESSREILFSTYLCHPSMANNELSGPVLATALAQRLQQTKNHYSYRFVFLPETIGSLAFLSMNLWRLKSELLAGFVLTCVGDEREFSLVPSRSGTTVADKLARKTASALGIALREYSWLDRGSDERQYGWPGVDLPFCSVTRSKYGTYPEYHTSLDRLGTVVTETGLQESYDFFTKLIATVEEERFPVAATIGEPFMSKRHLYPTLSTPGGRPAAVSTLMNVLSYCDGSTDLAAIADAMGQPLALVSDTLEELSRLGLVSA